MEGIKINHTEPESKVTRSPHAGSVAGPVTKFALSGLVTLIIVAVAAGLIIDRIGLAEAMNTARRMTKLAGQGVVEPHLTPAVLRGDDEALGRLDQVVRRRVLSVPLQRIKIWTPSGRVVYSDEPELIGRRYELRPEDLRTLETGKVEADLTDLTGEENEFDSALDHTNEKLVEVYMPVTAASGRKLLFEAYIPYGSVAAGGRRLWMAFAPALIAGLVLLELVQLPLAWSMAKRLRSGQVQREALLRRAIQASDAERRRIAGDLHDGVVQDLAGLTFSLSASARQLGPQVPEPLAETVREAAAGTRQSMRKLRTLLVDIYPPNLHSAGIEAALADLVAPIAAQGREVKVTVPPGLRLSPAVESLLFRTAQEALRNVDNHSAASSVAVEVTANDDQVTLTVKDDGAGFSVEDLERRRKNGHLGLRMLGDLATDAGGMLEINSEVGTGTKLRLEVPVA